MSEEEIQQNFRVEVLKELENEKTTLSEISTRVEKLERTVMHGNGHPALTVQVKELEVKVDNLSRDVGILRSDLSQINNIRTSITAIETKLSLQKENRTNWWAFAMVIATVVGTALVQHFLR